MNSVAFLSVSLASALLTKAPFLVLKMLFSMIVSISLFVDSEVIEDLTSVMVNELFKPVVAENDKMYK